MGAKKFSSSIDQAVNKKRPVIILVKKGAFEKYKKNHQKSNSLKMYREEALDTILNLLESKTIVVSTTGKASREIFEIRDRKKESHEKDFLTVGSMGHCSSIALGIALSKDDRKVVCIDGDGSMLMHLGNITALANLRPKNFYYILMNNKVHESVGGQDTAAKFLDLTQVASSIGFNSVLKVETKDQLESKVSELLISKPPSFLEVIIDPGSRAELGRPTIKPKDNKENFMKFLEY